MEYAKKMVVVSPEELARLKEGVQSRAEGPGQLAPLDGEMVRIMNMKHVADSEKWALYKQVLHRFLHFANESRRPFKMETISSNETHKESGSAYEVVDAMKNQTLESIPRTLRRKAELLYDKLKSAGNNVITWDDLGTVSFHGIKTHGSSITDLVGDAVRDRKSTNPIGWQPFAQIMRELNIPQEFIGNARRKANINDRQFNAFASSVLSPRTSLSGTTPERNLGSKARTPIKSRNTQTARWEPYSFRKK